MHVTQAALAPSRLPDIIQDTDPNPVSLTQGTEVLAISGDFARGQISFPPTDDK